MATQKFECINGDGIIEHCACAGSACPGWGHMAPAARHWCLPYETKRQPESNGRQFRGTATSNMTERTS